MVEEGAEAAVALGRVAWGIVGQKVEVLLNLGGDLVARHEACPACGQFNGERMVAHKLADVGLRPFLPHSHQNWAGRARPFAQTKRHRLIQFRHRKQPLLRQIEPLPRCDQQRQLGRSRQQVRQQAWLPPPTAQNYLTPAIGGGVVSSRCVCAKRWVIAR